MAESLDRTVTVCNVCASEMPEGANYGDPCVSGDGGIYAQHEDGLELEIQRLHFVKAVREGAKMRDGGLSSDTALESLEGAGIRHDIALKALAELGFSRPLSAKEAGVAEEIPVSDSSEVKKL